MESFFREAKKATFQKLFSPTLLHVSRIQHLIQGEKMKLANLSLAAIVVAGLTTSSFAADTLADAFKEGKISGEIREWYFNRNKEVKKSDSEIFITGLQLHYETAKFYGLSLGVTSQTSAAPFAGATAKSVFGTGGSNDDIYGSGTQISEAYVIYTLDNTTAKVGRQFIKTPMIGSSTSRPITQSFEGALVTNTDIPGTSIMVGAITKYQDRTDGAGNVSQFNELDNDHDFAYTAMVVNKSIPHTELTFQYLTLDNDSKGSSAANKLKGFENYYFEAEYTNKAGAFDYGLSGNFLYTDWESHPAAYMTGAKASLGYGNFKTYVAYSIISDDRDNQGIKAGLGGGAQPNYVKGYQVRVGTFSSDTTGVSVDANYNFQAIGLTTGARYTQLDVNSVAATLNNQTITDFYANYQFVGPLKGLETQVIYTILGDESAISATAGSGKGEELWFKATYKF